MATIVPASTMHLTRVHLSFTHILWTWHINDQCFIFGIICPVAWTRTDRMCKFLFLYSLSIFQAIRRYHMLQFACDTMSNLPPSLSNTHIEDMFYHVWSIIKNPRFVWLWLLRYFVSLHRSNRYMSWFFYCMMNFNDAPINLNVFVFVCFFDHLCILRTYESLVTWSIWQFSPRYKMMQSINTTHTCNCWSTTVSSQ